MRDLDDALAGWISEQRGEPVAVADLRRITTGHSRGNWFLELDDGSRYVVRIEQGGVFGTSGAEEFEFMQAVGRLGFPVAPVRWLEATGTLIGQPFFVMDFVEGGVPTDREDRSLAPDLAVDFVRRLEELHQLDWRGELDGPAPADATHVQIERWADVYRSTSPLPVPLLEEAAAWLHAFAPPLDRVALVHGDPGPGNFVHDGHRVLAFTDWEFTHLGDPTEDWSFLLSMRGARTMPLDDWIALIRREVGVEVHEAELRYWRAFNFFKGACANRSCLKSFAGVNPAPNMALIGTVLQQTFMRQMADLIGQ
jgi:aminoglycoside phosphotransferase (APT) family kinase protein